MRGIERPPWRIRADADDIADGTTSRHKYKLTCRGGPCCRQCGAPTIPSLDGLWSMCQGRHLAYYHMEQTARLVGRA